MLVAQAADGPRPGRHLRGWPTQTRDGCEASARVLSGPQTGEGTRLGRNEILAHLDLRCPFRPVQLLYPKCYRPSCCSGSGRTHCSLYLGLDRRSPPVFRPASRPTPQTAQKMGLRGQDEATVFGFETSGATSGAIYGFILSGIKSTKYVINVVRAKTKTFIETLDALTHRHRHA